MPLAACRFIFGLQIFCLAASAAVVAPSPARAHALYRWVQQVPGGAEARALTQEPICPVAKIDGRPKPMAESSAPRERFPLRVCAIPIPRGAAEISIDQIPLPLPKPRVDRILLIGDTGCRLKKDKVQDCNDISAWPFRLVADVAADLKPDLVLHLGDLLYRETACPPERKGCAGSPFGDAWETWEADFFKPAESLLGTAPFIFVRGNHEICARGGKGWGFLVDPFPAQAGEACPGSEPPYFVDLGGVSLLVFDVSEADDFHADAAQAERFRRQFAAAQFAGPGPVWLAFHKPIWARGSLTEDDEPGDNKTLALAARNAITANVHALLSGHDHTFQVLSYADDLPVQIIVGNGGDNLLEHAPERLDGASIDGVKVRTGRGAPGRFGFAMLTRELTHASGERWSLTAYDAHGQPLAACRLASRTLDCD
ncbi:metallophosphoesterase family protein [Methylocapsa acidiphila]|uniref:metallophosphoesterase family protein n=1 Tax=Methylocapsa acidiphila TaxID=133552 RepID=UPI000685B4AE|nr:metallophosphoesterase [Methylocapsa acidiphila]